MTFSIVLRPHRTLFSRFQAPDHSPRPAAKRFDKNADLHLTPRPQDTFILPKMDIMEVDMEAEMDISDDEDVEVPGRNLQASSSSVRAVDASGVRQNFLSPQSIVIRNTWY